MKNKSLHAITFIILTLASLPLLAGTYWVSNNGMATWAACQSTTPLSGTSCCTIGTANKNAVAGDTVYLRGGTFTISGNNVQAIFPAHSGTDIDHRIIFKAYNGETSIFMKGTGTDISAVWLEGNSYIKIDGIIFKNFSRWGQVYASSHHNEILNCTFAGDTGEEGFQGFRMYANCAGGGPINNCNVTHNWIHNNKFSRMHTYPANQSCIEGTDLLRIGLDYDQGQNSPNDNFNTVEDNIFEYAGHACFDNYGMYTVFRNNTMHNEPWIPDFSGGTCRNDSSEYTDPKNRGKYGHRNFQLSEDHARLATYVLVEGNRAGYASPNPANSGASNLELAAPRNILRYNYFYGAMLRGIYFKYATKETPGKGGRGCTDNRIYNNTIFHNGYGYNWDIVDPDNDDRNGIKVLSITLYNVIKNNIVYDSGHKPDIYNPGNVATMVGNWETPNGDPKFINPDISDPTSLTLPDLGLQSGSGTINAGAHLTLAVGAGNSSIALTVVDALYFQDGSWGSDLARIYGNFQADWIAVGSVNNVAQIKSINYTNNNITLKSPLTWADQAPIWLFKDSSGKQVLYGSAPDIGAYEYVPVQAQTINLIAGWNWISFNMLPANLSLDSVFSGILTRIEQLKTQDQSTIRSGSAWKGDLTNMSGIGQYKMYKVKVSTACILNVTGTADLSANPIHLGGGWNWVAYLPTSAMSITTALASISGQVLGVKSLTQSATYNGSSWSNTFDMQPGQGYAIKMSAPGILTYPAAASVKLNQQRRKQ
jgi:hypothetical protein